MSKSSVNCTENAKKKRRPLTEAERKQFMEWFIKELGGAEGILGLAWIGQQVRK